MKEKKHVSFDVVKGTLPKKKKVHYRESLKIMLLEPWHFSTVSLTLKYIILMMYLFVNQWIALQIPLGYYTSLLRSVISIIMRLSSS